MAQRVLVERVDDLDGSPATETIEFSLDGTNYQIDLNDQHAQQLRAVLDRYALHARRHPQTTTLAPERQRQRKKRDNQALTERIRQLASRQKRTEHHDHAPTPPHVADISEPQPAADDTRRPRTHESVTAAPGGLFLAPKSRADRDRPTKKDTPTATPPPALFTSAP